MKNKINVRSGGMKERVLFENLKKVYILLCISSVGSCILMFTIVLICAYLDPSYSILVSINSIGEADLEFLLLIVALPGMLYAYYKSMLKPFIIHGV